MKKLTIGVALAMAMASGTALAATPTHTQEVQFEAKAPTSLTVYAVASYYDVVSGYAGNGSTLFKAQLVNKGGEVSTPYIGVDITNNGINRVNDKYTINNHDKTGELKLRFEGSDFTRIEDSSDDKHGIYQYKTSLRNNENSTFIALVADEGQTIKPGVYTMRFNAYTTLN